MTLKELDLEKEVETEITDERKEYAKALIAQRLREIKACKKTLAKMEKKYAKLMNIDIEDLEMDDYDY